MSDRFVVATFMYVCVFIQAVCVLSTVGRKLLRVCYDACVFDNNNNNNKASLFIPINHAQSKLVKETLHREEHVDESMHELWELW